MQYRKEETMQCTRAKLCNGKCMALDVPSSVIMPMGYYATCKATWNFVPKDVRLWGQIHRKVNIGACEFGAVSGKLEVLKWARVNGSPWDEKICHHAALVGHLDVLQWAYENGCPWDEDTCRGAAQGGKLEALQWLRAHDCPWDKMTIERAKEAGHWDIAEWALENGCPS
jgi:hypothetical protein